MQAERLDDHVFKIEKSKESDVYTYRLGKVVAYGEAVNAPWDSKKYLYNYFMGKYYDMDKLKVKSERERKLAEAGGNCKNWAIFPTK